MGGQGESLDAAASTDTAGQHVVGVQVITTLREEEKHNKQYEYSEYIKDYFVTASFLPV